MTAGYVYILKNEAFPDRLKIGYTKKTPEEHIKNSDLNNTGVPLPYKDVYWVYFQNARKS